MTQILPRRGTAAQWTAANPVLGVGELGFETDTRKIKRGDGFTAWNSLAYEVGGVDEDDLIALIGSPEAGVQDALREFLAGEPAPVAFNNARGNHLKARLNAVVNVWEINVGEPPPFYIQDGDVVLPGAVDELPWTPEYAPLRLGWWNPKTLSATDGDAIALLPDLSGNANDLVQATAANRPIYNTTSFNGHPGLTFDGVNDILSCVMHTPFQHPATLYIAVKSTLADNTSGSDYLCCGLSTTTTQQSAIFKTTGEFYAIGDGSTFVSTNAWDNNYHLLRATWDGANSKLWSGVSVVAAGPTSTVFVDITQFFLGGKADLGATNYFKGIVGEALLLQGTPSSDLDTHVRDYFTAEWGV